MLEQEIKHLIVESLVLEDVRASDIDAEAPLFFEGLGLDSIDALELALALERKFSIKLAADDATNREILYSVRTLANHVSLQRTMTGAALQASKASR